MASPAARLLYGLSQTARVGWFSAHYLLARRLAHRPDARKPSRSDPKLAGLLRREMLALFRRDWANIEAGIYKLPRDVIPNPFERLGQSLRFFADLPRVERRRRHEFRREPVGHALAEGLPNYYLQNFHYQTDGYLSAESAELYDTQVEVRFTGAADAMRRQALVPRAAAIAGSPSRALKLVDVACGTGRFLGFVKQNWPRLAVTGIDLSRAYLAQARRHLAEWGRVELKQGAAEALPLEDASVDLLTCIFLFHELPAKVRIAAAREFARVLRPGGRLVLVDSLQTGDRPEFEPLLKGFPATFHEPYFADYCRTVLAALFAEAGLGLVSSDLAFLSKVLVFEKSPA
mgnify:CR=1 FL=1